MSVNDVLTRFQDPRYTGENRCVPCTVVNSIAAVMLAVALTGGAMLAGRPDLAPFVTVAVLAVSAAAIYFRGYLVPGTPTLTKRYFPPWLLSAFGKEPVADGVAGAPAEPEVEDFDVESRLFAVGAVEECRGGQDLCLTDGFEADWNRAIEDARESDEGRGRLLDLLGTSEGEVEIEDHDQAFRVRHDGRYVGTWESRAAFLADVAAAEVLEEQLGDWENLTLGQRGRLLNGLRLFLRSCPECGGELSLGVETVESCCTTQDVAALTCEDCEARLLETRGVPEEEEAAA